MIKGDQERALFDWLCKTKKFQTDKSGKMIYICRMYSTTAVVC